MSSHLNQTMCQISCWRLFISKFSNYSCWTKAIILNNEFRRDVSERIRSVCHISKILTSLKFKFYYECLSPKCFSPMVHASLFLLIVFLLKLEVVCIMFENQLIHVNINIKYYILFNRLLLWLHIYSQTRRCVKTLVDVYSNPIF